MIVVDGDAPLREAAGIMREQHVGAVVVVSKDGNVTRPIGVVTDRDLVVAAFAADVDLDAISVKDVMSGDLVLATTEDDLWYTVQRMSERGVRRLPVTDSSGALQGILALDDLIELVAESMNNLAGLIRHGQQREKRRQVRR
ncbi:MAG: CBS domain-containing protein [Gammaproteobacteria bacterium]|nr:CBS domain-containing protein [Gammaproteobacteria bacterium]